MNIFKKKPDPKAEQCPLEKCKTEISEVQNNFQEFLKRMKARSEEEVKKNGSWLKQSTK